MCCALNGGVVSPVGDMVALSVGWHIAYTFRRLHIKNSVTYISYYQVSSDETERLIKMEETLHQRVIGQEEAVVAISRAIRRARVGLKNPNRPIASFIFSGPTGKLGPLRCT